MSSIYAACQIQKVVRGRIARKRVKRLRFTNHQRAYQLQFETQESLFRFKFQQTGAAIKIQRWFRTSFTQSHKLRWRKKFVKLIAKCIAQKKLRRIIRRCRGYEFSKHYLTTQEGVIFGSTLVLQRTVRGLLGKRRFTRLRLQKQKELTLITKIQSTMRTTIVRQKLPNVGTRFRMLRRKENEWKRRQSVPGNLIITEKQLKTLQAAAAAAEAQQALAERQKRHTILSLPTISHTVVEVDSDSDSDSGDEDNVFSYTRRSAFLFVNMRLGDIAFLDSLDSRILKIQCAWYRFKACRRVCNIRENKRLWRILQLQRWFKNVLWRKQVRKATRVIQPIWKERVRMIRLRRYAATAIQSFWRCYVKYNWLRRMLNRRKIFGRRLSVWIVRKYKLSIIHKAVKKLRAVTELRAAGSNLYQQTEQHWLSYFLWQGIKKTKSHEALHELQRLFTAYSLNGNLESVKFVKMMKECANLISSGNNLLDISINTLELQFAKIKVQNEKRIDYAKFVDLLFNLAIIKFLRLDPAKALAPHASDGKDVVKSVKIDPNAVVTSSVITSYAYNGLKGKAALVVRFFLTYITTMPEYKGCVNMLGKKSAKSLSATHIAENHKVLQTFVINRLAIDKLRKDMIRLVALKRENKIRNGANQIQKAIRGFLGRRQLMRIAQTIYTKYIDGETEREYWYNIRTNRSLWTKPTLLGIFDCGMATRMPKPEEQYSIYCKVCVDGTANCYCLQCNEPECLVCFASTHKGGQRKTHTNLPIDNCIQCDFQVGTRFCVTCRDLFCDSCYKYMHRKGRLRYHVFQRTSHCCEICDDLTAQWKETAYPSTARVQDEKSESEKLLSLAIDDPMNTQQRHQHQYGQFTTKLYCGRCYVDTYQVYPEVYEPYLVRLEFYGKTITAYRNQQAEDQRKKEIAEKFARRTEELRVKRLNASVATIQRIARGFMKRRQIKDFLIQRREFMRLRQEEEKDRNSLYYKLTTLFGISPVLKSDTPLERVMKLYPVYMHHILAECVDNKWNEACRLLVEHEEVLHRNPPSTLMQRTTCKLSVVMSKRGLTAADRDLEAKRHVYEGLERRYRQAESTGVLPPSKMRKLQGTLNRAAASMNKALDRKENQETRFAKAQEQLTDCIGPRGLQTLIEHRRKHGISMPFRVSIRKNSKLALVGWENADYVGGDWQDGEEPLFQVPQYNFQPGRWRERLRVGDMVIVNGVTCRILKPPPKIAEKKLVSFKPAGDESSAGENSESNSKSNSKSKKSISRKMATTDSSVEDIASMEAQSISSEIKEVYTEDHIQLDRPWLLDDCYNVEIFKVVPSVFYMQPVNLCTRLLVKSYPAQKLTAIAAIVHYKLSKLYERIGNLFDEESSQYSYWHNEARLKMVAKDEILKHSRGFVQMSFDFTLRRKTAKLLYSIFKIFVMLYKTGKSVSKMVTPAHKETPFEYWQRSLTKVDIHCVLDLEGNNVIELGEFKMDISAPCEIMREYIKRNFRETLNETVGDSFQFFRIDPHGGVRGERLKKDDEFKVHSKDYAVLKTDKITMMSAMTATLVRDPDRGRVIIEEYAKDAGDDDEELQKLLK